MSLRWPPKDPEEHLDYTLRWDDELERLNDSIFSSAWRIEGEDSSLEITGDGVHTAEHLTYVWLKEGTDGSTYNAVNTIETTEGRTYERSVRLQVRHK